MKWDLYPVAEARVGANGVITIGVHMADEQKTKFNVLADYTAGVVQIEDYISAWHLSPSEALEMARNLMRAAYSLGYEEPKAESAGGGA